MEIGGQPWTTTSPAASDQERLLHVILSNSSNCGRTIFVTPLAHHQGTPECCCTHFEKPRLWKPFKAVYKADFFFLASHDTPSHCIVKERCPFGLMLPLKRVSGRKRQKKVCFLSVLSVGLDWVGDWIYSWEKREQVKLERPWGSWADQKKVVDR